MSVPVSDLQAVAPSAIIELFELELVAALHGTAFTYRFHAGTNAVGTNGNIVWAGDTYSALPIEATGFEYTGQGQLPRPTIRTSNLLGSITAVLLSVNTTTPGNDLTGAKLTRIRTLARYIDGANFPGGTNPYGSPDPTAEFPREIYYVSRKVTETRDIVEFELAAAFDLAGIRSPKRQCIANLCQWIYRSAECTYSGTDYFDENDKRVTASGSDVCGKRLSSCQARFGAAAQLPFGSFPGIGTFNG
jgi:lambda family phage minor tail protein L